MSNSKFQDGQRVIYIPGVANGDPTHEACERGVVMGQNSAGTVIHVMFSGDLHTQPCDPETLRIAI